MNEATLLFSGSTEEGRIVLANAQLLLDLNDIEGALNLLSNVSFQQEYYVEAKKKMANIYLIHKNDKIHYAKCYSEIIQHHSNLETFMLLGDAYMNVQDPEQAILVYKTALKAYPNETCVLGKLGKALTKTHDYQRAISFYEDAIHPTQSKGSSLENVFELKLDLIDLYIKLGNYELSKDLIDSLPSTCTDLDIHQQKLYVTLFKLKSKLHVKLKDHHAAFESLLQARANQLHLMTTLQSFDELQKAMIGDICFQLGNIAFDILRDLEQAETYLNECIGYVPLHKKALRSLVKLSISKGDVVNAQVQCSKMIKNDVGVDEATVLIADLFLLSPVYEDASSQFELLLKENPIHYTALSKFIHLLKRHGKLKETLNYFESAQNYSSKVQMHGGYHYCKGLYFYFTNNWNESLKEFAQSRKDKEFGVNSLVYMIEIFLNTENTILGGDTLNAALTGSNNEVDQSLLNSISSAEKLTRELETKSLHPEQLNVLKARILISSKEKKSLENGMEILLSLLKENPDHVSSLYSLAVAYVILKQQPRARNQLKRLAKMEWNLENGQDLERGWLLLADLYIQNGKYDLAIELLKKCIHVNKSCSKAFEYLGFVMVRS